MFLWSGLCSYCRTTNRVKVLISDTSKDQSQDVFKTSLSATHASLWALDVAGMMPPTSCTDRLETVWKRRRTEISTAGRCFCSERRRDAAAELNHQTTAADADAARHQDAPRPSAHRTWRPRRRHGRLRTQPPSTQTWKTPARDGWRRPPTTRQRRREAGKTWPRDPADRNPADCPPDTDLTRLPTKTETTQSSIIFIQPELDLYDSRAHHSLLPLPLLLQHPFNSLFSRTTWVSRHQKGKPFWILLEQETMGWQWHQLDHMQIICTSLQTDNDASTSPLSFYRPDALPATQPTVSKHWRIAGVLSSFIVWYCCHLILLLIYSLKIIGK